MAAKSTNRDAALAEAFAARDNIKRVAAMLGVSSQAVSQWKRAPASAVWAICEVSGIPAWRLRPDLPYLNPEAISAQERAKWAKVSRLLREAAELAQS